MSKKSAQPQPDTQPSNTIKDPAEWTVDEDLTKAEASKRIEELQEKTGRGKGGRR